MCGLRERDAHAGGTTRVKRTRTVQRRRQNAFGGRENERRAREFRMRRKKGSEELQNEEKEERITSGILKDMARFCF